MFHRNHSRAALFGLLSSLCTMSVSISQEPKTATPPKPVPAKGVEIAVEKGAEKKTKWIPLIESDSLKGWDLTNFGGEGAIEVSEGVTRFGNGDPLTGITFGKKDFPKENFELRWKAMRFDGSDFFAGVTFPVGDEFCSFVAGGWGGGLVGLSNINGNNASENETASFRQFKNKQWYSFRVRVDKKNITAWVDDEEVLKVEREKGKFSVHAAVMKSRPLGYCVFQSIVDLKEWEYQILE